MKKGFTLIELMVVIVIIGILAAIAIPKLFGMTAKAKASEVGPSAGTWSKLQQAYILDVSSLGSFVKIGYTPPGKVTSDAGAVNKKSESKNFSYSGTPAVATDALTATWEAVPVKDLGDCKADVATNKWGITLTATNGEIGEPAFTVFDAANADCQALTPNFKLLQ